MGEWPSPQRPWRVGAGVAARDVRALDSVEFWREMASSRRDLRVEGSPTTRRESASMRSWLAYLIVAATFTARGLPAHAADKPNIIFILGDDVGWFNIGAYHQGIMAGRTPNLDRLAAEGMRFTDYYAEASCTAGRANF